jgi:hypothetical protein
MTTLKPTAGMMLIVHGGLSSKISTSNNTLGAK